MRTKKTATTKSRKRSRSSSSIDSSTSSSHQEEEEEEEEQRKPQQERNDAGGNDDQSVISIHGSNSSGGTTNSVNSGNDDDSSFDGAQAYRYNPRRNSTSTARHNSRTHAAASSGDGDGDGDSDSDSDTNGTRRNDTTNQEVINLESQSDDNESSSFSYSSSECIMSDCKSVIEIASDDETAMIIDKESGDEEDYVTAEEEGGEEPLSSSISTNSSCNNPSCSVQSSKASDETSNDSDGANPQEEDTSETEIEETAAEVNMNENDDDSENDNDDDESMVMIDGYENGLKDVKPQIGMNVDIRDPEYIWSSASIVAINEVETSAKNTSSSTTTTKTTSKVMTTIRYDGWGAEWDETLHWSQHNPRLAKAFTYTKCYKCFVELLSKEHHHAPSSSSSSSRAVGKGFKLWPCRLYFRMPDPTTNDSTKLLDSEEFLRTENKIYIRPFGLGKEEDDDDDDEEDVHLLPKDLESQMKNHGGGLWLPCGRIRKWRDELKDIRGEKTLVKNLEIAHQMAMKDDIAVDVLPPSVFEKGSLLNENWRVKVAFGSTSHLMDDDNSNKDAEKDSSDSKKSDPVVNDQQVMNKEQESNMLQHRSPPRLPEGFEIKGLSYPGGNIQRGEKSGRWYASVTMGGNDVFLGSYSTQSEANARVHAALNSSNGPNESCNTQHIYDSRLARIQDINAVPLENIVASVQPYLTKDRLFSAHEWALEKIKYEQYLNARQGNSNEDQKLEKKKRKKRKQSNPKKFSFSNK